MRFAAIRTAMQKFFIYLVSLGHLCVDLAPGALPGVLPFFVLHYGMSYTQVAGLMFAASALSSVVQPIFGYWADKASRQWFMALGIAMSGLGLGLSGLTANYWLIFASVMLMGLGGAIFHPEAARLVNRTSGDKKATGIGIFSVGGTAGFGFGPLIAAAVMTAWGTSGTLFFAAVGAVMAGVMLWAVPRMLAWVNASAQKASGRGKAQAPARPGRNNWPAFARMTFVIICRSIASTSVSAFLPLYCIHKFGITEAASTTLVSFLSIVGVFLTVLGGWLTDRIGLIRSCRFGYLLMAPAFALILVAPSVWWIYPILVLLSFALNGTYAAFVVLGQSYLAKNIGFASGVTLGLSFSIGGMATPLLGKLADVQGLETVMGVLVAIGALCALASFFLPDPQAPGEKS